MIYATCTGCEFEISGQSLDELDEKFNHHFVMCGHDAYFYKERDIEKIRKIA